MASPCRLESHGNSVSVARSWLGSGVLSRKHSLGLQEGGMGSSSAISQLHRSWFDPELVLPFYLCLCGVSQGFPVSLRLPEACQSVDWCSLYINVFTETGLSSHPGCVPVFHPVFLGKPQIQHHPDLVCSRVVDRRVPTFPIKPLASWIFDHVCTVNVPGVFSIF